MKPRQVALLILSLFFYRPSFSQQAADIIAGIGERTGYDKIYLHTDRDYYFLGDTIWYKAYYLDGQTNRFIQDDNNLRVELIDKSGNTMREQLCYLEEGRAPGRMTIADSLEPGQYLLRAYTDRQMDLGNDYYFHKTLEVSKIRSTLDREENMLLESANPGVDLAFLPEGGFLLEGRMNTAGIKTLDQHGRNMAVMGEIINQDGIVVSTFETSYKGMDTIRLRPLPGENYHIRLAGYPAFHQQINNIWKKGIKLEFSEDLEQQLLFQVVSNTSENLGKTFLFVIMHRGSVVFQKKFNMKEAAFPIRISNFALPSGINRFILLNDKLVPVSERLYFSQNYNIRKIRIEPDRASYSTRSPVHLELSAFEEEDNMGLSNLSLSVVASSAVDSSGKAEDIHSWLLINSELHGHLESPSDFFLEDSLRSSAEKLDLLMLTQGWSSYLWNTLPVKIPEEEMRYPAGISLSGTVLKAFTKRPVVGGRVVCNFFNQHGHFLAETGTDNHGRFLFEGLYLPDTVAIFLNGYNAKGKLYTEVFLDPLDFSGPEVASQFLPVSRNIDDFPVRLYQQEFFNQQALRDYSLRTGSILLEEVSITNKYTPVNDGHFRVYSKPKDSFKVTDRDYGYMDVFSFLQTRVSLSGPPISFASGASGRLLLLDGVQVTMEILQSIPMSNVDVVEYIKPFDVTSVSIFGTRGAGGVISVFTKKGGEWGTDNYVQGTLADRIKGFSIYREFYSPVYTPETIHSDRPDYRITLYWNPEIILDEGSTGVSFFTSDEYSRFRVLVEGVTNTGEICLGETEFTVSAEHTLLGK